MAAEVVSTFLTGEPAVAAISDSTADMLTKDIKSNLNSTRSNLISELNPEMVSCKSCRQPLPLKTELFKRQWFERSKKLVVFEDLFFHVKHKLKKD